MVPPRSCRALAAVLLMAAFVVAAQPAAAGTETKRVSVSGSGQEGNAESINGSIAAGGRWVLFDSAASNFAVPDANLSSDVFLADLTNGAVARVSVGASGVEANGDSFSNFTSAPALSSDGSRIVFTSSASNLSVGDTNGAVDVFLRDRNASATTRLSVSTAGTQANNDSADPSISADGNAVVFESVASNLVASDTNAARDVFVRDLTVNTTVRASVSTSGAQANGPSYLVAASGTGAVVAFVSEATNLVGSDTNGKPDVFIRNLNTGTTTRVSVTNSGGQANGASYNPVLSADGSRIAFESEATNLVTGDTNGASDVFVRDIGAATTKRVSITSTGAQANDGSYLPAIASAGRYVAFSSDATNIVADDANGVGDIFVYDILDGSVALASGVGVGGGADALSVNPSLSGDGSLAAFETDAGNLVAGDTNGASDVFVASFDLAAPAPPLISVPAEGAALGSTSVAVSGTAEPGATVRVREGATSVGSAVAGAGGSWSLNASFAAGAHTITATATDGDGNESAPSPARAFTVDTTPPAAPMITSPAEGSSVGAGSITVGGTAEAASTVRLFEGTISLGTAAASSTGAWSTTVTLTTKGTHKITAEAVDRAGNMGPRSAVRTFTVVTAAPVIVQPAEGTTLGSQSVTIGGTAEPGATVTVYEGTTNLGSAIVSGGSWALTRSFSAGNHSITARATGSDGSVSPATAARTFTIDLSAPAPAISTPAEGALTAASVTITGTTAGGVTEVKIYEGTRQIASTAPIANGFSVPVTFAGGKHTIYARSVSGGVLGPPSANRAFTVDASPPNVAITVGPGGVAALGHGQSLTGTANDRNALDSGVVSIELTYADAIGNGDTVLALCSGCPGGNVTWSYTLQPGVYTVSAVATDAVGNRSTRIERRVIVL